MSSMSYVRARIDESVKNEAANTLSLLGLTMSDFIRIAVTNVALNKAVPFEMKIPNKATINAMNEAKGAITARKARFNNGGELFNELEKNNQR